MGHPNVSLCLSHPHPLPQGNKAAKRWLICTPVWHQSSCANRRSRWQMGGGRGARGRARTGVPTLEGRSEDECGWGTETGYSHGGQGNLKNQLLPPGRMGVSRVWTNIGTARATVLRVMVLHWCCLFYRLKARPSTIKKMTVHSTLTVWKLKDTPGEAGRAPGGNVMG